MVDPRKNSSAAKPTGAGLGQPSWWLAPYSISTLSLLTVLILAVLTPVEIHWGWRRPTKFLTLEYFMIGFMAYVCIASGSFFGSRLNMRSTSYSLDRIADDPAFCQLLKIAQWGMFAVVTFAYFLWFGDIIKHPSLVMDLINETSDKYNLRDSLETQPGVTTLSQIGIAYTAIYVIRWLYIPKAKPKFFDHCAMAALAVMGLGRAFLWSERLGLIEFLMPIFVLLFRRPKYPLLTALGPIFAVGGLFGLFSVFEYFRSWLAYYQYHYNSFFEFAFSRLAGYYVTAVDNGAGFFQHVGSFYAPIYTINWFWNMPLGIGQQGMLQRLGFAPDSFHNWIYWYSPSDYINSSGVFMPFVDFGVLGGLIFWLIFGIWTGLMYRSYVKGSLFGLFLYPTWFTGLIELPRVPYLFQARYLPAFMAMVMILMVFHFMYAYKRNHMRLASARQ